MTGQAGWGLPVPARGAYRGSVAGNLRSPGEFEATYDRYSSRVYASALRVLRDPARAEDVTQDVFLRLWSDPGRFDPRRGGLASYLQLMAHSRALDLWRSDQAAGRAVERAVAAASREPAVVEGPERLAERRATRASLVHALQGLPAAQREALVLRYFGELTLAELARRLGVPFGTAKGRVRLGLQKLASELEPDTV
jgi:RNA polymerase sigma-70 factor (ECF subfamily)